MSSEREALPRRMRRMAEQTPERRNRHVDLLRAVAICAVVLGHWLLFVPDFDVPEGVSAHSVLDDLPWAVVVTWVFQVMPIVFLVGGYANAASLASHYRSGHDATSWLLSRTGRLLRPTTALLAVLAAAGLLARTAGVDPLIIGTAVWAAAIPLWFLAVYLGMVFLAPLTHRLHQRLGLVVPIVLVGLVIVFDIAQFGFDVAHVPLVKYLLAWLAVHQAGYCWHDGLLPKRPWATGLLAGSGLAVALLLTTVGPYPVLMVGVPGAGVANSDPPTLALLALAAAQLGLALLLQHPANRWLRGVRPWSVVVGLNTAVFTIFLWHMTAGVLGAGLLLATDVMPQPPLDTPEWLLLRIPWIACLAVLLVALTTVFGGVEAGRGGTLVDRSIRSVARGGRPPERVRKAATVVGFLPVLGGLVAIALAGEGDHGPAGLPTAAYVAYFGGAAVIAVVRATAEPAPR